MLPENVPAVQLVQAAAAPRLYWPGGQAAAVGRKEPGAHAYPALQLPVQRALVMPDTAPYRPAAQLLQTPAPPKLYCPAGHTIAVALVDPATQKYPAAQLLLQLTDGRPAVAPYVPAGHRLHWPAPPTLYWPATHIAAVALVEPATQA